MSIVPSEMTEARRSDSRLKLIHLTCSSHHEIGSKNEFGIYFFAVPFVFWRVFQRFPIPGDASVHQRFQTLSGVIMIPVVLATGVILLVAGNDWNHGRPKRALLLDVIAYALLLVPELMHQYAVHVL
ncbi:hypothetical protein KOR42_27160 [Thalassoglobus neptunius]|uniref:Uncharacterized protein n=1 Tax=Thalassoglobus neptunius TaxID=1938619 RepID=A0A5C5WZ76_9PLAN|nr:hypothetical protein [Thalassoglobus neptunius]TWT55589.1 hypothetical protein KOR42_27160 [Thalassoglobus neptunius]